MLYRLTKIEELDAQHPGLADQVRNWLAQGVTVARIADLLFDRYHVSLSKHTVGRFRKRRWVPEQDLLRERRVTALVEREVAREIEIRDSLAYPTAEEL
jgi:hypothetical protein